MRDNFHEIVNNALYSILFDHKLTKLFCIEISGAKHSGKVLIIIIILFLIIVNGLNPGVIS